MTQKPLYIINIVYLLGNNQRKNILVLKIIKVFKAHEISIL